MGKSGTHSIAAIFGGGLRSAHEPESRILVDVILERLKGRIDDDELRAYLRKRDRRLRLDVDSSLLNIYLLDQLVELFPAAKFILTIRNPYAWLDSIVNQQLSRRRSAKWNELRDLAFRSDFYTHSQEERALENEGLYTLDGYLSGWASHNRKVIDTVPEERLLIVRTDEISESIDDLAAFAGVSRSDLERESSHVYRAREQFHLLEQIDQTYLRAKIEEHCGDLMARFFPEIE
jgi:hypothetical protein